MYFYLYNVVVKSSWKETGIYPLSIETMKKWCFKSTFEEETNVMQDIIKMQQILADASPDNAKTVFDQILKIIVERYPITGILYDISKFSELERCPTCNRKFARRKILADLFDGGRATGRSIIQSIKIYKSGNNSKGSQTDKRKTGITLSKVPFGFFI